MVWVPYAAQDMFDLIEQAEHYPSFVPWCTAARILERSDEWVAARLEFSYLKFRFGFATRNPKRRPLWLQVRLVEGPFRHFQGEWTLTPLGESGCKVDFALSYEIAEGMFDSLTARAVGAVATAMVDAFVRRADATLQPIAQAQGQASPPAQTAQTGALAAPRPLASPLLANPEDSMSSPLEAELLKAVGDCPLAAGLSPQSRERLAAVMRLAHWRAGEVLAAEGAVDDQLYVVVGGSLSVVRRHGTAEQEVLASLRGGDLAHELGFLDGTPRYASLVAATDAQVLELGRVALESLLDAHPRLVYSVICAILGAVHRNQTRLSVQSSELTNYIVKQHGRY